MEWIRISENKLKIMLTAEDARRYSLCGESVDLASSYTRKAFRALLSDLRTDIGFDATAERVYIQMYPSKAGGCELFLTKTEQTGAEHTPDLPTVKPESETAHGGQEEYAPEDDAVFDRARSGADVKHTSAWVLSDMEDTLAVCGRLLGCGFVGDSSAWQDENGGYWLFFAPRESAFPPEKSGKPALCHLRALEEKTKVDDRSLAFLTEYGKRQNPDAAKLFLAEHGKCICPVSAVEILGMLQT